MNVLLLLTLLTGQDAGSCAVPPIGSQYRELPGGFESHGGSLLGPIDGVEWAIAEVECGGKRMLWLERLMNRDEVGRPTVELHAVLILPAIPESCALHYGEHTCRVDSRFDPEIVAIVQGASAHEEYIGRVRLAWRASRAAEAFQAIPTIGVDCENPAYGL